VPAEAVLYFPITTAAADTLPRLHVGFLVPLAVDALLGPVLNSTTSRTPPVSASNIIVPFETVLYSGGGGSEQPLLILILILITTIEYVFVKVVVLVMFINQINVFGRVKHLQHRMILKGVAGDASELRLLMQVRYKEREVDSRRVSREGDEWAPIKLQKDM